MTPFRGSIILIDARVVMASGYRYCRWVITGGVVSWEGARSVEDVVCGYWQPITLPEPTVAADLKGGRDDRPNSHNL